MPKYLCLQRNLPGGDRDAEKPSPAQMQAMYGELDRDAPVVARMALEDVEPRERLRVDLVHLAGDRVRAAFIHRRVRDEIVECDY